MWDAKRLRLAADAAGIALWSWNLDTDEVDLDARSHILWDLPRGSLITLSSLLNCIHREDVDRVRSSLGQTTARAGRYEIDFRIMHSGDFRWISARGEGHEDGMVGRTMFAIFLDVTPRKEAEHVTELLVDEMSHRVKNVFAIASGLTSIALRSASTATEMAHDLNQRLVALGSAHDLVRPNSRGGAGKAGLLRPLLEKLLDPYTGGGTVCDRVAVACPDILIGGSASAAMALIIHELATNSIKYGALSRALGKLDVQCRLVNGQLMIVWAEEGGPEVRKPIGPAGFGSRLMLECTASQLRGSMTKDWRSSGLVVTLHANLEAIAA